MTKPTIILITADELNREALSCWGAKSHATPAIDRLARQGDSYDRAYTPSPICLPARCSIATGLYPHRSRSYSNGVGAPLNPALPNMFSVCREAGYATSLHGKGHFTPCPYSITDPDVTQPLEEVKPFYLSLGMDHCDLQDDKNNSLWFYDDYSTELERKGLLKACRDGRAGRVNKHSAGYFFPGSADMHPDSWVGRKSIDYINAATDNRPHFMWVSFSGPHYPIDTPNEYYQRVNMDMDNPRTRKEGEFLIDNKSCYRSYHGPGDLEGCWDAKDHAQKNHTEEYWREWRRMYYGNVVLIDEYIGKIIAAAERKWGDNLLIAFTADHGDMMGNHDLWGKNGASYEDIVRVPLIVRYPGQKSGVRRSELVSLIDLYPTVAEYAGAGKIECDGRALKEWTRVGGRGHILSEQDNRLIVVTDSGFKMIRAKTCRQHGDKQIPKEYMELYDLNEDPYEFTNQYDNPAYAPKRQACWDIYDENRDTIDDVLFV